MYFPIANIFHLSEDMDLKKNWQQQHQQQQKQKQGKRFPHATWTFNMEMIKNTLFSQHTNMHNSCCGNYAFMAEKKTLPLSFNILLCYGWKKSFYMVKNTTRHLQYNSLLLWHWKHMVKIDNGIKSTEQNYKLVSQPLTFKAQEILWRVT